MPVRRPVAVVMVTAAAAVFGLVSYNKLPLALFPELTYPTLTVRVEYAGAAPEEVEESVVQPIEELVSTVDGLVRMRSIARPDRCDVVLEFGWSWSVVAAAQEVRERLDLLRLPEGATRPLLLRYDPSLQPVLRLGLYADPGGLGLGELRDHGDRVLRRTLERLEGVAAVSIAGGREREVVVALDGPRLASMGLSAREVAARLRAENVNIAGGDLSEGGARFLVRTLHQLRTLDDIRDLVLVERAGALIRLGDVGRVSLVARRPTHLARFLGREGVELAIYREADANLVSVARRVRRALDLDGGGARRRKATGEGASIAFPDGVHAVVLTDQSRFIEAALAEVRGAAVLGGVLALVVLFLFLRRPRATAIAAVAIPVSVVATFAPLYLGGVSLNIMSLGGLALGVGMLVDNAVVVLESIARRREAGDDAVTAAVTGVGEVGGAVSAATLTTAAVFVPMIFVEGVAGQAFGDLAISVVVAVLASLAVALTLVPMLASRTFSPPVAGVADAGPRALLRRYLAGARGKFKLISRGPLRLALAPYVLARGSLYLVIGAAGVVVYAAFAALAVTVTRVARWAGRRGPAAGWLTTALDRGYAAIEAALLAVVRAALRRPVMVLAPVSIFAVGTGVILPYMGSSLVPAVHRGLFDLQVSLPASTPIEETAQRLVPVEEVLARHPDVELVSLFAGVSDEVWRQEAEGEHTSRFRVRLHPGRGVALREERVLTAARSAVALIPDAVMRVERPELFSFTAPVEVIVTGIDLPSLRRAAEAIVERLQGLPELTDVRSSAGAGFPEIRVRLREAALARLGLSADTVGQSLRDQVFGRLATPYRPGTTGDLFDIVVRTELGGLPAAEDLSGLTVGRAGEIPVPLAAVAELSTGVGPVDVRHMDGVRAVAIESDLAAGVDLAAAAGAIRRSVAELELPVGVEARVAGQDVERQRALSSLRFALLLAVFLVYAVMAAQFESFTYPLLIMVTVPLGLLGAVLGLAAVGTPITILVLIGGITLVGIVVNNAIVLLDRVQRERAAGGDVDAALIEAVRVRLRPILMTTLTTVCGLLPLALGTGEGAELRSPIAVTLIFGLAVSTVLTLVVLPVLYRLVTRQGRRKVEAVA